MGNIHEDIGEAIKELRELRGLTQKEVAARLAVTPPVLHRIEHGTTNATIDSLEKIATALNARMAVTFTSNTGPGEMTVQEVVAEVADAVVHPADICRALEHLINQDLPNEELQMALKAARGILCRLDPQDRIPGMPKWV